MTGSFLYAAFLAQEQDSGLYIRPPKDSGPYPESRTLNKKTSCCRMKSTTGGLAMPRNYTKVEHLSAEILRRKHAGETNRQIAESYHLTVEQVKTLVTRQKVMPL